MGGGGLIWLRERPANFSTSAAGAERVVAAAKLAAQSVGLAWCEKNYLLLRRGPYVIASGLDESIAGEPRKLSGRFVNLFDASLTVRTNILIARLCENSELVILKDEKMVQITFAKNKNAS